MSAPSSSPPPLPKLYHGRPDWPSQDDGHLFWVALRRDFRFAHHPAHLHGETEAGAEAGDFFCAPKLLKEKLTGVLEHSAGGSILVTGYRGTGKTSLVEACRKELERKLEEANPHRKEQQRGAADAAVEAAAEAVARAVQAKMRPRHSSWMAATKGLLAKTGGILGVASRCGRGPGETAAQECQPPTRRVPAEAEAKTPAEAKTAGAKPEPKPSGVLQLPRNIGGVLAGQSRQEMKSFTASARQPEPTTGLWWMKVNLSTVSSAHEVLLLTYETLLREIDRCVEALEGAGHDCLRQMRKLRGDLAGTKERLRATRFVTQREPARGMRSVLEPDAMPGAQEEGQHTYEREALSGYQTKLTEYVRRVREVMGSGCKTPPRLVFVFDELDKLQPTPALRLGAQPPGEAQAERQTSKLEQLQRIVAELKFFLTESPSHQIFIAGRDVEDSWAEDQNKGEGLFESIFALNVYVPSIFSTDLVPCAGGPRVWDGSCHPGKETMSEEEIQREMTVQKNDFYRALARELGIPWNSWAFRTTLLVLPHLAEFELYQLVLRVYRRLLKQPETPMEEKKKVFEWLRCCYQDLHGAQPHLAEELFKVEEVMYWQKPLEVMPDWPLPYGPEEAEKMHKVEWQKRALAPVMSERTCRRLRILLEYLTYKGRGIPRKVLREMYEMVRDVRAVPKEDPGHKKIFESRKLHVRYVLALRQHTVQKMNFYAGIVEYLDMSLAELRGLNDKGRVSIYHIIDYMLKFYATGFSQRDIEHANFMTTREELFPSRKLAALILRVMEARLWKRIDSRGPDYRLLHPVAHDLGVMYLRYAPEQTELRHTQADFRAELEHLQVVLADVPHTTPEQRLSPVHAQIRMARILDLTGRHFEARLAYFKALRWLRMDISHFEEAAAGRVRWRQQAGASLSASFITPFVTYAIEVLLALGQLNEEMGEHRPALLHYHEAEELFKKQARLCGLEEWMPPLSRAAAAWEPKSEDERKALKKEIEAAEELFGTLADQEQEQPARLAGRKVPWQECDDYRHLLRVVLERGNIRPLDLDGRPGGYVEACNHSAVAYSKMWERASGNMCMLRGLVYLHHIGDEYGVVDQMFFIGQVMVRRRDFRSAALWYLEALRRVAKIRDYSDFGVAAKAGTGRAQSGAAWQTPAMITSTEAQILASLADVWHATGGLALLPAKTLAQSRSKTPGWLRKQVVAELSRVIRELKLGIYEDRPDEYFHTAACMRFQSVGDHISVSDVSLRQLELRQHVFHQAAARLDAVAGAGSPAAPADMQALKYDVLNSWSTFWHSARVLLHTNLNAVTALTRDRRHEWGRITDFRRMGALLRLVGKMLKELALHRADHPVRCLLTAQTRQNNACTLSHVRGVANPIYHEFIAKDVPGGPQEREAWQPLSVKAVSEEIHDRREALDRTWETTIPDFRQQAGQPQPDEAVKVYKSRVSMNRAARDARTIFAFVSDKEDLLTNEYGPLRPAANAPAVGAAAEPAMPDLEGCGFRSMLFRLDGQAGGAKSVEELDKHPLLLAHVLRLLDEKDPGSDRGAGLTDTVRTFRLLALAEKALLTSYLCVRDTIPDFSYATTVLETGQVYISALYHLGLLCQTTKGVPFKDKQLLPVLDRLMENAKRFLVKAIDTLRREREQNRNTFHLLSEAYFNLGDLMLLRQVLLRRRKKLKELLEESRQDEWKMWLDLEHLMGKTAAEEIDDADFAQLLEEKHLYGDTEPEDVRRQAWEAYRDGLVLVQTEMDQHTARYRFPGDIYYAHGNVMDAVLHFRICKSARARHSWVGGDTLEGSMAEFQRLWQEIATRVAEFESPQRFDPDTENSMREMLNLVNRVRTDRGPLHTEQIATGDTQQKSSHKLTWKELEKVHQRQRLDLFHPLTCS